MVARRYASLTVLVVSMVGASIALRNFPLGFIGMANLIILGLMGPIVMNHFLEA